MTDSGVRVWLALGVAAGFLLDWGAIAFKWKPIKRFSKPLAMILVIVWTGFHAANAGNLPLGLLLTAQIFGLLGDILLLFPQKAFAAGLGAFLAGHCLYSGLLTFLLVEMLREGRLQTQPLGLIFVGITVWIVILGLIYRIFKPLPQQESVSQGLWLGIQVYSWVLSAVVVLALISALRSSAFLPGRVLLPLGAMLFLVSDLMLTYNRFIKPFHRAQLWVRITYHLAQFSLAWGFLSLIL